ncbi:hypothetical protein ANN_19583 [Periplaneta americana]|uniref:Mos1 transposase HTH domain-containing protein n=1 Tax=Periplaneta americana TaxID=6978 RepID=A0ABQ8SAI2_PERAM|nr:hypothetical protein ANN_19583 [Periplaneta americana]
MKTLCHVDIQYQDATASLKVVQDTLKKKKEKKKRKENFMEVDDDSDDDEAADKEINIQEPDRSHLVQRSEMETLIPSPATCEVRSVIKFFNAQSIAPIEIHRQLCQVYGPNIMSKQMVRRWCRQFSEGRQSVHDEEHSGRPSLISDDRVELVRQYSTENRRFTITEMSSHFPQISRSLLHDCH